MFGAKVIITLENTKKIMFYSHRGRGVRKKQKKLFLMFVSSCRALVIRFMALALRTSSYANSITLITITIVITNIKKQKHRLCKPKKHD